MVLNKIEKLLEKYFDAETSITEENELRRYFSSEEVAPHLEQYKLVFGYFANEKTQHYSKSIIRKSGNQKAKWFAVAASVVVLLGVSFFYLNHEKQPEEIAALGTYNNPEIAFKETQKALAMLSSNVNVGIESVQYVQEFETTKNRVFKN
jgi:hypothetical protein